MGTSRTYFATGINKIKETPSEHSIVFIVRFRTKKQHLARLAAPTTRTRSATNESRNRRSPATGDPRMLHLRSQRAGVEMIYFITTQMLYRVKIGAASDPKARMAELQVGNPEKLVLMRKMQGGVVGEKWLHEYFAALYVRGEWFKWRHEMYSVELPPEVVEATELPPKRRRWTGPVYLPVSAP